MHTKIVTPKSQNTKAVYTNTGSCLRAVNYFGKDEEKGEKVFFSESLNDSFDKKEVASIIDNNVKGLKQTDEKFDSIIVSPSESELAHIGNDPVKLQEFTRKVMNNYASNFNQISKEIKTSKPVEFLSSGSAPYLNNKKNKQSYFLTYKLHDGKEKTLWGVDLKAAVDLAKPLPGDKIHVEHLGINKSQIDVEVSKDGKNIIEQREIKKNLWSILSPEQMEIKIATETKNKESNLDSPKLVWFATVHNSRQYSLDDAKLSRRVFDLKGQGLSLKEIIDLNTKDIFMRQSKNANSLIEQFYNNGPVKKDQNKPGDQRHIHIIVSRRDREMKMTLNPNTYSRFKKIDFMKGNGQSFKDLFNFQGQSDTLNEFKENTLRWKTEHLNKKYNLPDGYLEQEKILNAFRNSPDKELFMKRFNKLDYKTRKEEYVKDTVKFLSDNADKKEMSPRIESLAQSLVGLGNSITYALDDSSDLSFDQSNIKRNRRKFKKLREAGQDQSR